MAEETKADLVEEIAALSAEGLAAMYGLVLRRIRQRVAYEQAGVAIAGLSVAEILDALDEAPSTTKGRAPARE